MIEFYTGCEISQSPFLDVNFVKMRPMYTHTLYEKVVTFNMGYEARQCLQKIGPWFYLSPIGIVREWH